MRFDSAMCKMCALEDKTTQGEIHYFPDGLVEQRPKESHNYEFRTLTITQSGPGPRSPAK